jgi:hypothetical protein
MTEQKALTPAMWQGSAGYTAQRVSSELPLRWHAVHLPCLRHVPDSRQVGQQTENFGSCKVYG